MSSHIYQTSAQETESLRQAVKPVGSAAVPRLHSDYPLHTQLSRIVPELLRDNSYTNVTKHSPSNAILSPARQSQLATPSSQGTLTNADHDSPCMPPCLFYDTIIDLSYTQFALAGYIILVVPLKSSPYSLDEPDAMSHSKRSMVPNDQLGPGIHSFFSRIFERQRKLKSGRN